MVAAAKRDLEFKCWFVACWVNNRYYYLPIDPSKVRMATLQGRKVFFGTRQEARNQECVLTRQKKF